MNTEQRAEVLWLNQYSELSLQELAHYSGMSESDIIQCVEEGAIVPANPSASSLLFNAEDRVTMQAARRLRDDFELDIKGLAIAITLIERIRELEAQLNSLHALVPYDGL